VNHRHPLLAWLLGWLVPGAGHWYLGQRARGAVLCGVLVGCFVSGALLGGRGTVSTGHPEFLVLQWGAGLPAAGAWAAGDPEPADLPVARRELGILYTLVPALLNMVAALDAAARAAGANPGGPEMSHSPAPSAGGPPEDPPAGGPPAPGPGSPPPAAGGPP
jgi:hypothetical protein